MGSDPIKRPHKININGIEPKNKCSKCKIWSIHYNKIFKRVVQQNTKKPFAYDDHNMKTERNI